MRTMETKQFLATGRAYPFYDYAFSVVPMEIYVLAQSSVIEFVFSIYNILQTNYHRLQANILYFRSIRFPCQLLPLDPCIQPFKIQLLKIKVFPQKLSSSQQITYHFYVIMNSPIEKLIFYFIDIFDILSRIICKGVFICSFFLFFISNFYLAFFIYSMIYTQLYCIMKSMQSIQGSFAIDSIMSPPKNNKSTTQLDTMASLQFSDLNQNQSTYLKLNSIPKQYNHELLASRLSKIDESIFHQDTVVNDITSNSNSATLLMNRFIQLELLQKWMCQACLCYYDDKRKFIDNQDNIRKMEHRNRLKKDQLKHVKDMVEYLEQRYEKMSKQMERKMRMYEQKMKDDIRQSRERAENLYFEIKKLEEQIDQQKQIQKQLFTSSKSNQSNQAKQFERSGNIRRTSSRLTFHPENVPQIFSKHQHQQPYHFNPHYPPYQAYPPYNPYQPHQPHQAPYYHHYQYQYPYNPYYPGYQLPPNSNESRVESLKLNKSPSFESVKTPDFLSKKVSFDENNNFNPKPINNNLILEALANNLQNLMSHQPANSSPKNQHKSKNTQPIEEDMLESDLVLQLESPIRKNTQERQFQLTLSHMEEQDQSDPLYSPTNGVTTPQFDLKLNKISSFDEALKRVQKQPQTSEKTKRNNYGSTQKKIQMEESKIRIDIDDSMSDASKFSIQKRKRPDPNVRQSTIRIDMIQDDSKSGENSMISDPNNTPRLRSPTIDPVHHNSSFEKLLQEGHSTSQILSKPLPAPPKLPNQGKKLRKVTEQQSDLFDSTGAPRMQKKVPQVQKNMQSNYSPADFVLDKSNIVVSEKFTGSNYETINLDKNPENIETAKKMSKIVKKITDQDEDDDDFMNVNLLAVSKISKQKEYSQGFKTISDDGNEIPENRGTRQASTIHKSQNITETLKPGLQNIAQQQQFTDKAKEKRQAQVKRIRKSSGSRFSLIQEPNPETN